MRPFQRSRRSTTRTRIAGCQWSGSTSCQTRSRSSQTGARRTVTPGIVVPGARISIAVDVVPKKGMHVYAPGTQYRPVVIRLKGVPPLRVGNSVYPKPTVYRFKPLNEDVLVYDGPFRLVVEAIASDAIALRAHLRGRNQITIRGTLDYQACDDRMCYLPASVPFQWTL